MSQLCRVRSRWVGMVRSTGARSRRATMTRFIVSLCCVCACGDSVAAGGEEDAAGSEDAAGGEDAGTNDLYSRVDVETGMGPGSIAVGDFDGDSRLDVVTANRTSGSISILLNITERGAATPSFMAKVDLPTARVPINVAVDDLNGDGKADLIIWIDLPSGTPVISVLLNTTTSTLSFAPRVLASLHRSRLPTSTEMACPTSLWRTRVRTHSRSCST